MSIKMDMGHLNAEVIRKMAVGLSSEYCRIDDASFSKTLRTQGMFFSAISNIAPMKITCDLLNPRKAILQAELIERYRSLPGKKVLELGSGLGVNLIVWTKKYGIDGYGVDADSEGFLSSIALSRGLFRHNGIEARRITPATGEYLPFKNNTFDILFSTNVLEHTTDPLKVLGESLRVMKPGGIMQFVYPNYRSFFDGHYAVFHPPVFWSEFFPWYVRMFCRRDPAFARTLKTELNVSWTRNTITQLKQTFSIDVLSLGSDIFEERMGTLAFEPWAGLTKVKKLLTFAKSLGLNRIAAEVMVKLQLWTPIILTAIKRA